MQHKFNAICKPNQLTYGTGQIAIVTGWTPTKVIAKLLQPEQYAVIGQLYSASRGIDFLVRNLLANPHVHAIAILEATKEDVNSGSVKCLSNFFNFSFEKGISDAGRECWVVRGDIKGYIDADIPESALRSLQKNVANFPLCTTKEQLVEFVTNYQTSKRPWGEPQIFPKQELIPVTLSGTRYGHRIEAKTIADAWVKILHRIKSTGTIRPTGYDGKWQELIDLMAVVTDEPPEFYFPEPNYLPVTPEFIKEYLPQVLDDAPYVEGVKYSYGQRLRSWFGKDQIEQVINKLVDEIDAASAVMNLWDVVDHIKGGSPCLNHIWVRVVDGELSLTATLRSNDMFGAWVPNAMGLRSLQRHIYDEVQKRSGLELAMGPLITVSQSAHIYGECWEHADKVIADNYDHLLRAEMLNYYDACGNYIIEIVDEKIIVTRTTPQGETVTKYSGDNPLNFIRNIAADAPAIAPSHIGYLGVELEKACRCLKLNQKYIQDSVIF